MLSAIAVHPVFSRFSSHEPCKPEHSMGTNAVKRKYQIIIGFWQEMARLKRVYDLEYNRIGFVHGIDFKESV